MSVVNTIFIVCLVTKYYWSHLIIYQFIIDYLIRKLKTILKTRWVERYTGLMTFKELHIFIVIVLEEIKCGDSSRKTSSLATVLESVITKSKFLFALKVAVTCFAYTLNTRVKFCKVKNKIYQKFWLMSL